MKKISKLLSLFLVITLLVGCMKIEITNGIGADKSVTIEMIYAIEKSAYDQMNQGTEGESSLSNNTSFKGQSKEEMESLGFVVTDYKTDEYVGTKYTKKYQNIEEISTDQEVIVEIFDIFDAKKDVKYLYQKTENGNYKANFTLNFAEESEDEEDKEDEEGEDDEDDEEDDLGMDTSQILSSSKLSYEVTLPSKVVSSNATTVSNDGKRLSWELDFENINSIQYEFNFEGVTSNDKKPSGSTSTDSSKKDSNEKKESKDDKTIIYIAVGAGTVAVLVIILLILTKKKKATPAQNQVPAAQPVQPAPMPVEQSTVNNVQPTSVPVEQPTVNNVQQQPATIEQPQTQVPDINQPAINNDNFNNNQNM